MYQPYSPAGPPQPPAPKPVLTAAKFMYGGAAVSAANLIAALPFMGDIRGKALGHPFTATPLTITVVTVAFLVPAALWLWMARAASQGRSWARILSTVLFVLATLQLTASRGVVQVLTVAPGLADGLAVVWLLWRRAPARSSSRSAWCEFRRRSLRCPGADRAGRRCSRARAAGAAADGTKTILAVPAQHREGYGHEGRPPMRRRRGPAAAGDAAVIESSWREPERFAVLFDRHAPHIHRYLARRADRQVADDLVAETFLAAFAKRNRYDLGHPDARPWLYGIATNLVGQHRRDEARQYRIRQAAVAEPEVPGHAEKVAADVTAQAMRSLLAEALAALSAGDRDVLLLIAWSS